MHDMRIAAKRLRYLLELVGFCFGEVGGEAQARARELQEVLGEIHDCDVMLARIASSTTREPRASTRSRTASAASDAAVRPLRRAVGGDRDARGLRDRLLAHTTSLHQHAAVGA